MALEIGGGWGCAPAPDPTGTSAIEPDDDGGDTFGTSDSGSSAGPPDAGCGPACDPGSCDPWTQSCPEGQKCVPYSADGDTTWNGLRCSPVVDQPGQLGDPCTAPEGPTGGLDDCDVGLVCWGVTLEQTSGTCVEQCGGTPNAPTCSRPETVCSIYNDGVLTLCLPTCDPLDPACPEDQLCIPRPGGQSFVCAVDASPTTGAYGDPCLAFNKCDPGLFCASAETVPGCVEASGCCSELCDLSAPDPDAACSGQEQGQQCIPWYEQDPPPGAEDLGACAVPG